MPVSYAVSPFCPPLLRGINWMLFAITSCLLRFWPSWRFPTAPLQTSFNHGQISLTEIVRRGFGLPAKTDDIHEAHLFALLFALPVTPVHGQAE